MVVSKLKLSKAKYAQFGKDFAKGKFGKAAYGEVG